MTSITMDETAIDVMNAPESRLGHDIENAQRRMRNRMKVYGKFKRLMKDTPIKGYACSIHEPDGWAAVLLLPAGERRFTRKVSAARFASSDLAYAAAQRLLLMVP